MSISIQTFFDKNNNEVFRIEEDKKIGFELSYTDGYTEQIQEYDPSGFIYQDSFGVYENKTGEIIIWFYNRDYETQNHACEYYHVNERKWYTKQENDWWPKDEQWEHLTGFDDEVDWPIMNGGKNEHEIKLPYPFKQNIK